MQDEMIVRLYWQRDETAICETQRKYGRYLHKIAFSILNSVEDSEESVNDTYMRAWNAMPPHRPSVLAAFLSRITRQVSIDIWRSRGRDKRRASEYALSLSELEECVSGGDTTCQEAELRLLSDAINAYLRTLKEDARTCFVGRYYFMDSIKDVAAYCGMSVSGAKSLLYRTRQGLRDYLEQEGFTL